MIAAGLKRPIESNRKRDQGSSSTVASAGEEEDVNSSIN
jgi:hypothetical protein